MKKFSKIHILAITGLLVIVGLISFALAQSSGTDQNKGGQQVEKKGFGRHFGRGGFHRGGQFMKALDLTDAQKAQFKQIRENFRTNTASLRQELGARRQELRKSQQDGSFNEALATQKLQEMAGVEAKLMSENFKMRQEMLAALTPEQKAKMEQLKEQFKSRWAEHRSRLNQ